VTITPQSITYEYEPIYESKLNPPQKWSYKTISPKFKLLYEKLTEMLPLIMNMDTEIVCTDVGSIEFIIYADKKKESRLYWSTGDDFKDCFAIVKQMVSSCELIPSVLSTSEDYAQEETEE